MPGFKFFFDYCNCTIVSKSSPKELLLFFEDRNDLIVLIFSPLNENISDRLLNIFVDDPWAIKIFLFVWLEFLCLLNDISREFLDEVKDWNLGDSPVSRILLSLNVFKVWNVLSLILPCSSDDLLEFSELLIKCSKTSRELSLLAGPKSIPSFLSTNSTRLERKYSSLF